MKKKYWDKSRKDVDADQLKKMETLVFDKKEELNYLIREFDENYPQYYDLKYKNEPVDVNTIQQQMRDDSKAFLEYFVGEEDIYLFTLTADLFHFQKIADPDIVHQHISTLRPIINNPPSNQFSVVEYTQLVTISNELHQLLVQPSLDQLGNTIKDLTIIPDYDLNYIPFEILLKNPISEGTTSLSHQVVDYLFDDFDISYDYSVAVHLKNLNKAVRQYKHDFIGFAPAFKNMEQITSRTCTQDELYALRCSENEIKSISELTNGKAILAADANRATFESTIADYKIIHLATHACIDEENANLNKIFLTDDYLSNFDLYNMQLNAELAVLSACNTGSGKLIKGEGVMSLARGFINAGCSSTLISMWSVDDCATSDIMGYFYEGLWNGLSKDAALKFAKIKYLDSVDKSKMHPYYWAAFVPFGDMKVINNSSQLGSWVYLVPLLLMTFLLIVFKYR